MALKMACCRSRGLELVRLLDEESGGAGVQTDLILNNNVFNKHNKCSFSYSCWAVLPAVNGYYLTIVLYHKTRTSQCENPRFVEVWMSDRFSVFSVFFVCALCLMLWKNFGYWAESSSANVAR